MLKALQCAQNSNVFKIQFFPVETIFFPIIYLITFQLTVMEYLIHYMLSLKSEQAYFV